MVMLLRWLLVILRSQGGGDQVLSDVKTVSDVDEKAVEKPEGIPIPKPVVDGEFNALEHQDIGSYKHVNLLPFLIHIGGG